MSPLIGTASLSVELTLNIERARVVEMAVRHMIGLSAQDGSHIVEVDIPYYCSPRAALEASAKQ